jgi:flagellar biosynthesis component FlhA
MTVGAAIVVVAAVFLLIVSPGFSKLAIIVFLAGAIGIVYLTNQDSERSRQWQAQQAQAERFATTSIRPEDLSLGDVKLVRGARGLLGYEWLLRGVVTNNSGHGLDALTFEVTVNGLRRRSAADFRETEAAVHRGLSHRWSAAIAFAGRHL